MPREGYWVVFSQPPVVQLLHVHREPETRPLRRTAAHSSPRLEHVEFELRHGPFQLRHPLRS